MTDAELIAAANQGDASAFEELYRRYRPWVFDLAVRFTHDHHTAQDVMQDTFIYWMRKFPGFELTSQLKTFLYPVVRHNALAAKRKANRLVSMQGITELNAFTQPESPASLCDLATAIDSLDAGHREALILRYVDGLTVQEIALAMEIPLGTVKSRLHHALRLLRANPQLKNFFENP